MDETTDSRLADLWQAHRRYLLDIAFRMLGSISEAEDVVQEAFIRLLGVDVDEINDVRGWLVVVVGRLCLDQLGSARARREDRTQWPFDVTTDTPDPADVATLDDSIRMALAVVLERLTPPERAAFVLHDVFQFSFEDVASIVGRSPAACRQLASRARRRMQDETGPARFEVETIEEREVAQRFIAACAGGDLEELLTLLDPDVAGEAQIGTAAPVVVSGREKVGPRLLAFFGPQTHTTLVSVPVNGEPGILASRDGSVFALTVLTVKNGLVEHIHSIADRRQLAYLSPLA
jgi:RNA polymerase sigma-70 factor (ECF subfamily)